MRCLHAQEESDSHLIQKITLFLFGAGKNVIRASVFLGCFFNTKFGVRLVIPKVRYSI